MKDNLLLIEMGKRISAKRKSFKLSQEDLSEISNVTPQMISTAERGEKAIRPENLLKISKALKVSTDYLLSGEINQNDLVFINDKLSFVDKKYLPLIEKLIDECIDLEK